MTFLFKNVGEIIGKLLWDVPKIDKANYTNINDIPSYLVNNDIVRSYRDVIVVTNIATRRTSKALISHVLKLKTLLNNINTINTLTMG